MRNQHIFIQKLWCFGKHFSLHISGHNIKSIHSHFSKIAKTMFKRQQRDVTISQTSKQTQIFILLFKHIQNEILLHQTRERNSSDVVLLPWFFPKHKFDWQNRKVGKYWMRAQIENNWYHAHHYVLRLMLWFLIIVTHSSTYKKLGKG